MHNRHMQDLYKRLSKSGFNRKFIRDCVLPDWWDDSMAEVPANRAIAEMAITRFLGFETKKLRNHTAALTLPPVSNFRLKCRKNTTPTKIRRAVVIAQTAVRLVLESVSGLAEFHPNSSPQEARKTMLETHHHVNLQSLLEFCWNHGVVVIHLNPDKIPKSSKKFDGMAMFHEGTPVIILGSKKDGPPWLAFHLAHEMAHIFCEHVKVGDKPLVDSDIYHIVNHQERQADEFAMKILTGEKELSFAPRYGLTARKLVNQASRYGDQHGIDSGTVALIYGRSADRWPAAQEALRLLDQASGAQQIIADALDEHLNVEEMPESTARFLSCLSAANV